MEFTPVAPFTLDASPFPPIRFLPGRLLPVFPYPASYEAEARGVRFRQFNAVRGSPHQRSMDVVRRIQQLWVARHRFAVCVACDVNARQEAIRIGKYIELDTAWTIAHAECNR
jgi:hypothetical protein